MSRLRQAHHERFATRRAAMDEVCDWLGFPHKTASDAGLPQPIALEQRWFAVHQDRKAT